MIDQKEITRISEANEKDTKTIFESLGFILQKLDHKSISSCPDYLVIKGEIKILCEVKTIFSAGFCNTIIINSNGDEIEKKQHLSLTVGNLEPNSHFDIPVSALVKKACDSALIKGANQYRAITNIVNEYKNLPFVLAIFYDFFANSFEDMNNEIINYPEISAIITRFNDCINKSILDQYTAHDIAVFIKAKEMGYNGPEIPNIFEPKDKPHWHYIINPTAAIPLDPQTIGICPFDKGIK